MSDYLKITLPFPAWSEEFNIIATSENGHKILNHLADNLGLSTSIATDNEVLEAKVIICEYGCYPEEKGITLNKIGKFLGRAKELDNARKFVIELEPVSMIGYNTTVWLGRYALAFLLSALAFSGKRVCPLHGSAFAMADRDEAVVLFGQSGIGKSTAMRRAVSQGGRKISDDMLLLSISDDNRLFVQALPTWSGLWSSTLTPEAKAQTQYSYEVKGVFALHRGDKDELVLADQIWWHQFLVQALHNHLMITQLSVSSQQKQELFAQMFEFASFVSHKFPPYEILSDLNGNLYQQVEKFIYHK